MMPPDECARMRSRRAMTMNPGPEPPSEEMIASVERLLGEVLGRKHETAWHDRRAAALLAAEAAKDALSLSQEQLVYGELDVRSVATLLEAVGVREGDVFVDIGSGAGLPTLTAALLYPLALRVCRGIEIVPHHVERARQHARRLHELLTRDGGPAVAPVAFVQGDIHAADGAPREALVDCTLALCFATTWSHGADRRELPRLSAALAETMPPGARVVVIDGRLLPAHGWWWEGDLTIRLPDTAPCSTASLFIKTASG